MLRPADVALTDASIAGLTHRPHTDCNALRPQPLPPMPIDPIPSHPVPAMTLSRPLLTLAVLLTLALGFAPPTPAQDAPAGDRPTVRVYILAGQSNMQGKGKIETLPFLGQDPDTKPLYDLLRDGDQWATRDDVYIRYGERHGPLTVGYGSRENQIGPELTFGTLMGQRHDAPVLIIKTCWGGKSLFRDFRPPSAALPDAAVLTEQLERAQRDNPQATLDDIRDSYGVSYRQMLDEVNDTLARLDELFPDLAGHTPELAGLVWFQGWNDLVNDQAREQYAANLVLLQQDVRGAFKSPELPMVIAGMGQSGADANAKMLEMRDAQRAAAEADPNSVYISTAEHWDPAIAEVYKLWEGRNRGLWTEEAQATWATMGSDRGYHYMGAGKIFATIGAAMAQAMGELEADAE